MAGTATATMLDTDLLTPLGAYLRLRKLGRASFLLESVEQGRLGRYSLVGAGSRLLDYSEAERCGEPVVGYLAYDFVARLEPTVPLPAAGRGLPESRFVAADALVRFDHVRGVAEILHGDAAAVGAALEADAPRPTRERLTSAATERFPSQEEYEAGVATCKEYIRQGDAFQIVLSQRAERPTEASAVAVYRALRQVNPSPYLFLLELDGIAPDGRGGALLARGADGGQQVPEERRDAHRHNFSQMRNCPLFRVGIRWSRWSSSSTASACDCRAGACSGRRPSSPRARAGSAISSGCRYARTGSCSRGSGSTGGWRPSRRTASCWCSSSCAPPEPKLAYGAMTLSPRTWSTWRTSGAGACA